MRPYSLRLLVPLLLLATCSLAVHEERPPLSSPTKHLIKKKDHQWKTGSWGSCYAPGGCGDGRRERPVWCSEPEGRTILEFLCDAASKPERSRNCFTACRHHRDKLQWQVGQWGPCLPVYPSSGTPVGQEEMRAFAPVLVPTQSDLDIEGVTEDPLEQQPIEEYIEAATSQGLESKEGGALGVMQRAVACVLVSHESRATHRAVDDDNCFTIARKPDPVRLCRVPTPQDCIVSDFSAWSGSCREGCGNTNETRVRSVLVAPHNGGKPCPQLTETRACNPHVECLRGRAEPVLAGGTEYKLKVGEWRRCEAPTSLVSADALYAPAPGSIPPAPLSIQQHSWDVPGHENYTYQPQVGYQTREVSCRDSKSAIVEISLCLGRKGAGAVPAKVRPCVVAQDCVVSQWSPWSRLQDGCIASSGEVKPEVHSRKRDVVSLQQGDGQPCPHLIEERRVTDKDQLQLCSDKFRWLASRWSACVVTQSEGDEHQRTVGCGGGVQLRSLSCVLRVGDRPVAASHCSTLEPLPTVQRCEVACPRDCEVGEWVDWGPCRPFDCSNTASTEPQTEGYRQRERTVVIPASRRGLECPAVREVQPCAQPACFFWRPEHWGPCQLDPGVVRCGEGRRTRNVVCTTLDGGVVSDSLCARRELKPPQDEPCLQPCPFDCVLSPWSAWSPCSHACSSPRQAALRQRNRTVVAPAGPGGHPCPDPDEMLQIEACNLHSCHGYSWMSLPWQKCEVQNSTAVLAVLLQEASEEEEDGEGGIASGLEDTSDSACGRGVQRREVWCMEANERKVQDWKCRPLVKPATLRVCSAPCPQDCEVSPWSEWSDCPQECVPDESNEVRENGGAEIAPTQLRHRVILRVTAGGGEPCPNLEEFRPCPLSAARCRHHAWWSGEWSQCQLPANVECGKGYRTRAVACVLNGRARVDPSVCMQEGGVVPPMAQPCHVACDFPCVLSEWGSWSSCHQACGGASMRRRTLIGLAASRAACRDPRRFPLAQSHPCPCSVYESHPEGQWSSCILDVDAAPEETANGRITSTSLCGAGRRFRARTCKNKAGNLVEPSRCGESGVEEEPCLVACPADCTLGEWSTWGECSVICGPGLQTRQRKVLRPALNGGRPCGVTEQTKVCDTPCSQNQWAISGWEDCRLIRADQQKGCGTGDQSRTVRCVHEPPHQPAREVPDHMCDLVQQPEDETACHVTCPGECVVTSWSDWSVCTAPCRSTAERQRTRLVLRAPAAHLNTRCPPLIEVQSCVLNETCFTYEWKTTEWSSCLPLGGSPCGEGVETRGVFCKRSDGRTVDDKFCKDLQKPSPGEKWCYVDCAVDCEVGEWSSWNDSACECGGIGSLMRRVRFISTNPSAMGRPCPIELVQQRSCPAIPCFTWHRSEWSKCDLHGATCGHGTVTRNVTCRREVANSSLHPDDLPLALDDALCLEATRHLPPFFRERAFLEVALDLKREDACYVPCRGDCEVAEWSHWSHCHRNCKDGEMGGYQTRSRAVLQPPHQGGEPCPAALYETRPCFSGPCLTFDWALREGVAVCQRSDGIQVTGGCDGKPKPCVTPCATDHAECTREGKCACVSGFAPRYEPQSRGRRLQACVPMSSPGAAAASPGAQAAAAEVPLPPEDAEIQSRFYYPKDDDVSVWMFAMIGIGCVFIVFVAVSIYLMCHSSSNASSRLQPQTTTVRQPPSRETKP